MERNTLIAGALLIILVLNAVMLGVLWDQNEDQREGRSLTGAAVVLEGEITASDGLTKCCNVSETTACYVTQPEGCDACTGTC